MKGSQMNHQAGPDQPSEDQPTDGSDKNVEGGFKIPGVTFLTPHKGSKEVFTVAEERIKVGVTLT